MSINRNLREVLLEKTKKRRFRVHMLNESQKLLRASIEDNLHLKKKAKTIVDEGKKCCPNMVCSKQSAKDVAKEIFPFLRIMRRYSLRKNLLQDVVAGITVGIMHIPQGMAYGFLSDLPPIYGLYTSFFPVLIYFFFGSSRHVSVGTFAVVSLMVGQVVNRGYQEHVGSTVLHIPANTTHQNMEPKIHPLVTEGYANPVKLGYALSVTFVVGILQLILGMLRMGFMSSFMSDPFISGFTTGAAVHVLSSQVKHLFDITVHTYHGPLALVYFYSEFFANIHNTNMVTFTASLTCLLVLILIKEGINNNSECKPHLMMPIPIELIVISISTIVSFYTKLGPEYGVHIVGEIPSGLPVPTISFFRYIPSVLGDGLTIGFIAYAISYSMAKILADKHDYRINANQELVALGLCNFVSCFFQSYCCCVSLSRSLVQDAAGGKSQVVGLVSSMIVLVVLLYIGPLFESLPECILACIVIVTLKGMFLQFRELKQLWKLNKKDFAVWLVTFISVVVLDVALGLLIGIIFSLYFVLRHSQKPLMSQMGHVPGTGAYKDVRTSKKVADIPGMKIFRFEASVYFANAEHFRDRLYEKTGLVPRKLLRKKRKAMHRTLQTRKQELETIEQERQRKLNESKYRRSSIEVVIMPKQTPPVDPYEEQLKKSAENKLILQRFSNAWQPPTKIIIVDLSVVNYVDTVAVKMLSSVIKDYKEVGIKVFLAGCKPEVRELLRNADFNKSFTYNCIYFTVHEAVVIGQEILDDEIKKKEFRAEDVKMFHKMAAEEEDPKKKEANEDEEEDFDDDDDEEEDTKDTHEVKSDDEDQWFDTLPDYTEMKTISRDTSPDTGSRDPRDPNQPMGSAGFVPLDVFQFTGSQLQRSEGKKEATKRSTDSSQYEMIPLQDKDDDV